MDGNELVERTAAETRQVNGDGTEAESREMPIQVIEQRLPDQVRDRLGGHFDPRHFSRMEPDAEGRKAPRRQPSLAPFDHLQPRLRHLDAVGDAAGKARGRGEFRDRQPPAGRDPPDVRFPDP
jgi:hypothetical protein